MAGNGASVFICFLIISFSVMRLFHAFSVCLSLCTAAPFPHENSSATKEIKDAGCVCLFSLDSSHVFFLSVRFVFPPYFSLKYFYVMFTSFPILCVFISPFLSDLQLCILCFLIQVCHFSFLVILLLFSPRIQQAHSAWILPMERCLAKQ